MEARGVHVAFPGTANDVNEVGTVENASRLCVRGFSSICSMSDLRYQHPRFCSSHCSALFHVRWLCDLLFPLSCLHLFLDYIMFSATGCISLTAFPLQHVSSIASTLGCCSKFQNPTNVLVEERLQSVHRMSCGTPAQGNSHCHFEGNMHFSTKNVTHEYAVACLLGHFLWFIFASAVVWLQKVANNKKVTNFSQQRSRKLVSGAWLLGFY